MGDGLCRSQKGKGACRPYRLHEELRLNQLLCRRRSTEVVQVSRAVTFSIRYSRASRFSWADCFKCLLLTDQRLPGNCKFRSINGLCWLAGTSGVNLSRWGYSHSPKWFQCEDCCFALFHAGVWLVAALLHFSDCSQPGHDWPCGPR